MLGWLTKLFRRRNKYAQTPKAEIEWLRAELNAAFDDIERELPPNRKSMKSSSEGYAGSGTRRVI